MVGKKVLVPLLLALLALAVTASGCRVSEYVVARDGARLYATSDATRSLASMPLAHHDRIVDADAPDGSVEIHYGARTGFVRRSDVTIVDYLDPKLDGGADRDERLGRTQREVRVAHDGRSWPPVTRGAVLAGRVLSGMTHEQVEASWGMPNSIECTRGDGRSDRWTYRRKTHELVVTAGSSGIIEVRPRFLRDQWTVDAPFHYLRVPIVEERVVDFFDGEVVRHSIRCYPDGAEGAPTAPTTERAPSTREPER